MLLPSGIQRECPFPFQTTETDAIDPDNEPEELILKSLHRSLQQVRDGKVHLISELWDGIEV